eukprot:3891734-Amphidinium_carterae.1
MGPRTGKTGQWSLQRSVQSLTHTTHGKGGTHGGYGGQCQLGTPQCRSRRSKPTALLHPDHDMQGSCLDSH